MATVLAIVTFKVYPPQMGGQKGVALFYRYLSKYHTIVMAVSADNNAEFPGEIKSLYPGLFSNKKTGFNIWRIQQLKTIIKEHNVQCVVAEHSYSGWIACLLKNLTGIPFIIHSHNLEWYRFQQMKRWWWKAYRRYEKWVHQQADYNFFISETDKVKAIKTFQLQENRCDVITYGIEENRPYPDAKTKLRKLLGVKEEVLLFFNGTLDYAPNTDAVKNIIDKLIPLLRSQLQSYKIIISGNRITPSLQQLIDRTPTVVYTGYVKDINLFYQGTDVFINPVINNAGIKTKVIEALANNSTVVSTVSGASGIALSLCDQKLICTEDNNWAAFAKAIVEEVKKKNLPTPPEFYQYYNWDTIAVQAAGNIEKLIAAI